MFELARLAAVYGNGELRLTVEQNVILTHIPTENLEPLLAEPLLQTFQVAPSPLSRSVISCTGARYCNFALIETKQRAWQLAQELDAELELSQRVRIHWTGCPNSCGQPQAGDIGLIGSKTRQDGQTVEAANIYTGGKVGKGACLGSLQDKNVPVTDLKNHLRQILIDQFGAVPK
jgi:ferredoxin-nitrite reductase